MATPLKDENFEAAIASEKLVVIDFWAEWCGPCRQVGPIFEELSGEMPNVEFYKMNVDENYKAPVQCGVRSIPTFIAFRNGKKVGDSKVGGMNKAQMKSWIESL